MNKKYRCVNCGDEFSGLDTSKEHENSLGHDVWIKSEIVKERMNDD